MVVRQPPVLLLDECTSALDPTTQEAAQKTILKDFPRQGGQGMGGQALTMGVRGRFLG
jgi:ABC-type iron transport system FetAB ATPase subunit